jgi:hypothetical protein
MRAHYDVIVVGSRCAGAPLAMLLARKGYRVLALDRATFPSDAAEAHLIRPDAVAALERWGLAERLVSSGCPPIHTHAIDFGATTITGSAGTATSPFAYCPRRAVLDDLLVDAAVLAGVRVREGCAVEEIVREDGRSPFVRVRSRAGAASIERASVIVGDLTATRGAAPFAAHFAYFRDLPMEGRSETYIRPGEWVAAAPTDDDLTMVKVGWDREGKGGGVEERFRRVLDAMPQLAERVRRAKRETPFARVGGSGDEPITARAIAGAFLGAERAARAIDDVLLAERAVAQ